MQTWHQRPAIGADAAAASTAAASPPRSCSLGTSDPLDSDGVRWMTALGGGGPGREAALMRLRALLARVAWFEVDRRRRQLRGLSTAQLNGLVRDVGDNACAALLEQLHGYRGQSRFEVWAAKFGIRETAAAARRRQSLDAVRAVRDLTQTRQNGCPDTKGTT